MERIVLEVDDAVASKWRTSSEKMKQQAITLLKQLVLKDAVPQLNKQGYGLPDETIIQQVETTAKENNAAYEASLDKLRKTAMANGLTPEILEHLLNE